MLTEAYRESNRVFPLDVNLRNSVEVYCTKNKHKGYQTIMVLLLGQN